MNSIRGRVLPALVIAAAVAAGCSDDTTAPPDEPPALVNDIVVSAAVTTIAIAVPPLPAEPVGIGARWTTRLPDRPTMTLLSTIELVEDRGDEIVVAVSSNATGEEGFRGGFTNEIVENGDGFVTIALATARPQSGSIAYESLVTPVNPPAYDGPPGEPEASMRTLTVEPR